MPPKPLYRGQGNEPFRTSDARTGAKRGQTVPYNVNGAPSGGPVLDILIQTAVAGEALGGNRAVYIATDGKAYYGHPDATSRLVSGVTTGAAAEAADVSIQIVGEMEEGSWSWNDDSPVWLAANGQLTQTLPTSGFLFQVGVPMGPTKLRIEPQLVAQLA